MMDFPHGGQSVPEGGLSVPQELTMVLLPVPIALLSTVASFVLCRLLIFGGLSSPYRRILFVISALDIISSMAFLLQPFLLPVDTSPRFYALGSHTSCRVTGMLFQLGGTGTALYSLSLSIFFLCMIRFKMNSSFFAVRVEPVLHLISLGLPVSTSIASYAMDTFHESAVGAGCFIDCTDEVVEAGECKAHITAYLFVGLPLFVSFAGVVLNNVWIFRYVRRIIRKSYKAAMNQDQQSERIQQVAVQASLYVAAYLGTYSWSIALRVLESQGFTRNDEAKMFPLLLLQALFIPSTGIFNLLIFLRRKYVLARKKNPGGSRRRAWQRAYTEMHKSSETLHGSRRTATRRQRFHETLRIAISATAPTDRGSSNSEMDHESMSNSDGSSTSTFLTPSSQYDAISREDEKLLAAT